MANGAATGTEGTGSTWVDGISSPPSRIDRFSIGQRWGSIVMFSEPVCAIVAAGVLGRMGSLSELKPRPF